MDVEYRCSLDNLAFFVCYSPTSIKLNYEQGGSHNFQVISYDGAGNTSEKSAIFS